MNLTTIRVNIATVAAGISGMKGASPREVDTIPNTPYAVVGQTKGTVIPGDRQVSNINFPLRLYIERTADGPRDTQKADDLLNAFVTTFAANQALSGAVQMAYITSWDSDVFYAIGSATYAAIDFVLSVTVHEHVVQHL